MNLALVVVRPGMTKMRCRMSGWADGIHSCEEDLTYSRTLIVTAQ